MMEEDINVDEIILNLKMISKIKQNNKMIIVNGVISVDVRVLQPLLRWYTSDTREDTIAFITNIINSALSLVGGEQRLSNHIYDKDTIKQELLSTMQGLDNLSATYKIDNLMVSKIDILREKINKTCVPS